MAAERILKVAKGSTPSQTALAHLRGLLESGSLDGLVIPIASGGGRSYIHGLVTRVEDLEGADPFAPVMPVNGAIAVSRLTKLEAPSGRVGVVLRPCEIAAAIELNKLLQARLDQVAVIGVDCPGTISVQDHIALLEEGADPFKAMAEDPSLLREACIGCDWTRVQHADLVVGTFGSDGKHIVLVSDDEALLGDLEDAPKAVLEAREAAIGKIEALRVKAIEGIEELIDRDLRGVEAFAQHFGTCIVCHNCMDQCPVCYCNECFFESQTFRYEGDKMMLWARNRGGLAMPTDKAMFHLGRMGHMASVCVGCGMCTQACPVDINVGRVFKHVASKVQSEFDYKAGRSMDDPLPQATYLEDELEPR